MSARGLSFDTRTLALLTTLACGCVVGNPFADGETGLGSSGNATTGDGDGDATSEAEGDGDGPTICTHKLWVFASATQTWSSSPIAEVDGWSGPWAPACDVEIWAATYLETWDQLWVVAADQHVYRFVGGAWLEPQPIAALFPTLADAVVDSIELVAPPPLSGASIELSVYVFPNLERYEVYPDGGAVSLGAEPLQNIPAPGPAQAEVVRVWAATASGPFTWETWHGFADGWVYRSASDSAWESWPAEDSPLFAGDGEAPDPASIGAGWADRSLGLVYVIAP